MTEGGQMLVVGLRDGGELLAFGDWFSQCGMELRIVIRYEESTSVQFFLSRGVLAAVPLSNLRQRSRWGSKARRLNHGLRGFSRIGIRLSAKGRERRCFERKARRRFWKHYGDLRGGTQFSGKPLALEAPGIIIRLCKPFMSRPPVRKTE
jgi:hypothetical protein